MMNKEDLIILYSGGADSRLILELALKTRMNPWCVLVQYGQLMKELDFAINQLQGLEVPYQVVGLGNLLINSGLTGDGKEGTYEDVNPNYVPGRNTILLSLAFSIAESRGIDTIWYGADYSDRIDLFPDSAQEYIIKINELFQICGANPIKVEAPLLGFTKELVLQMLEYFGIQRDEIFSGYNKEENLKNVT